MYICTGVYMVRVYTCHDLEKAYMIMWKGTGLEVESHVAWMHKAVRYGPTQSSWPNAFSDKFINISGVKYNERDKMKIATNHDYIGIVAISVVSSHHLTAVKAEQCLS